MARITMSETLEIGNKHTGYYRRWNKTVDLEGTANEVNYLVSNISDKLMLPAVKIRKSYNDNMKIDSFPILLKLNDK